MVCCRATCNPAGKRFSESKRKYLNHLISFFSVKSSQVCRLSYKTIEDSYAPCNEMDVFAGSLEKFAGSLSVSVCLCNWAVGQIGSRVLIQGEHITWFAQCFAIGFGVLRLVTVQVGKPSPLLLYRRRATRRFLSVAPRSAKFSLMCRPRLKMVIFGPGAAYAACTAG